MTAEKIVAAVTEPGGSSLTRVQRGGTDGRSLRTDDVRGSR
jgi:hypothetical protein